MIVRAAIQALMATFRKGGREKQGYAGMIQAEELGKPISDQPVGLACSAKAARLMQKAIQTWQNQASEHLEAYMESLEQEMQKADGAENSAKQRMVLRWAVAALSPPRCHLSDGCEGKMPVSNTSNDQSTPGLKLWFAGIERTWQIGALRPCDACSHCSKYFRNSPRKHDRVQEARGSARS
ncbi:unnamed protein product [Effrenium voratum]|uniref:Uncharacterized protein n=1 Tax=Effrenium voratum TaxID=2562239 RepID=A0AA36JJK0_9DINO|nr:unnamed protein product [Effrenium voratum]CAJ1412288.1 unnamed protein product [Effrenium voratum]